MKYLSIFLLCIGVSFSIGCTVDYYSYLNSLLSTSNLKCINDPPLDVNAPCVSAIIDSAYEAELIDQYDVCMLLDPSLTYTTYTYLSDWPQELINDLSIIIYRYSGLGSYAPAVVETITYKSFNIVTSDNDQLEKLGSSNVESTADVLNLSWVYAAKYVIDYWVEQYYTHRGMGFGSTLPGFKIHPLYILNCIAVTSTERKRGIYINDIIQRINDIGLGEMYDPATPDICPATVPLPWDLRFSTQKITFGNRGGLIQLMANGFVPIVAMAFDLNTLRFMKAMDVLNDTPIVSQATQPSLFGVVRSFDSNGPHGPYWEVITNILPAMSVTLSLKISPSTTNANTHGIASFAVGVKLNYVKIIQPEEYRVCDEQSFHPGCKEIYLHPEVCEDTAVTTLDLSKLVLPTGVYGFFIPETADCRHITDIQVPNDSDWYCAFAEHTISPSFYSVLLSKCMVVEGYSMAVDDTPRRRRRLQPTNYVLGFHGDVNNRNNKTRAIHVHPGPYDAFNRLIFSGFDRLEVLVIGSRESAEPSFNTIGGELRIGSIPKLAKLVIAGQSSFNSITSLSIFTVPLATAAEMSASCTYVSSESPYESVLEINVKDSFALTTDVTITDTACFKHFLFNGENSGNMITRFLMEDNESIILEDISFLGSSSWQLAFVELLKSNSLKKLRFEGTNLMNLSTHGLLVDHCAALERVEFIGEGIYSAVGPNDETEYLYIEFSYLSKLQYFVVNGTGLLERVYDFMFTYVGSALSPGDSLNIMIEGQKNLVGKDESWSSFRLGRISVPIIYSPPTGAAIAPFSKFDRIVDPFKEGAACSSFVQYMRSGVSNKCT